MSGGRGVHLTKPSWMTAQTNPVASMQPSEVSSVPAVEPPVLTRMKDGGEWIPTRTPEGHTYYYNTQTGLSSWENPSSSQTQETWKMCRTEQGNTYYYNTQTGESRWDNPDTPKSEPQTLATPVPLKATLPTSTNSQEKEVTKETYSKASRNDRDLFMQLLRDCHIQPHYTWEQALGKIIDDPRYQSVSLLADRKAAFYDYLTLVRKEEEKEAQQAKEQVRRDFLDLLDSHPKINEETDFLRAEDILQHEPQWISLSSDLEKEALFDEFISNLRRTQKEQRRKEKKENKRKLRSLLENADFVNINSQWRDVRVRFADEEPLRKLDPMVSLRIFEEYIRGLESKKLERDRMSLETSKQTSRQARTHFRGLLEELYSNQTLGWRTTWREILPRIKNESAYRNLLRCTGATPEEIFEDYIDLLKDDYYPRREQLLEIQEQLQFSFAHQPSQSEYMEAFEQSDRFDKFTKECQEMFYEDMITQEKRKLEEAERKRKKIRRDFTDYLDYKLYKKIDRISWEEAKAILSKRSVYKDLGDEVLAEELFHKYKKSIQREKSDEKKKSKRKRSERTSEERDRKRKKAHG